MFKGNIKDTGTTPGVFIVNFEQVNAYLEPNLQKWKWKPIHNTDKELELSPIPYHNGVYFFINCLKVS